MAAVTELLARFRAGDDAAEPELAELVYAELHRMAQRYMRRERAGHTLQPSALVNEAYMRLVDQRDIDWQNRAHFFGVAAHMMRRVLVDHARSHGTRKRGGGLQKVELDEAVLFAQQMPRQLVALDDALTRLAAIDARQSRIVELRFFGGLTEQETAETLGISSRTVKRD